MKPYPAYKESSFEFLGKIPLGWDIKRAKYVYFEVKDPSKDGSEKLLSVSEYYGVKPRSEVMGDEEFITRADTLEGHKKCQIGDLVMNIMLAWKTGLGVTDWNGIVSPSYAVFRPSMMVQNRFLHYLLRTNVYVSEFKRNSTGIIDSRLRLYPDEFLRIPILLPSFAEQQTISDFLDRKTSQVDTLIAKKQRQIDLLQEQRTTLINEAITKGLNHDSQMKASDVEWLGDIPHHWGLLPLKRVIKKFVDYRGHTPIKTDSGILLITARNIRDGHLDFETSKEYIAEEGYDSWMVRGMPEKGDVLVTMEAPLGATAQIESERVALAQRLILLKADKEIMDNTFLKYYFLSQFGQHELYSRSTGSTAIGIKASKFYNINIVIPPLDEQQNIAEYLVKESARILTLIAKTEKIIDFLKEYRTALISEAVTGKIDVRTAG